MSGKCSGDLVLFLVEQGLHCWCLENIFCMFLTCICVGLVDSNVY